MPDLSQMTREMRELLKKDVAFVWVQEMDEAFERVKKAMTEQLSVHPFDPKLPIELLTDASKLFGLGFMLLQRKEGERVRIIQCGSFSLTAAQKNYAVIELEMLAIVEAVRKCDFYLRGCHWFLVVTDHKPLEGIFKKPLTEISNDRLLRFREALMPYNFSVTWRAGKTHEIADALSRAPVFGPPEFDVSANSLCQRIVEDPSIQLLFDAIDEEYKTRCTRLTTGRKRAGRGRAEEGLDRAGAAGRRTRDSLGEGATGSGAERSTPGDPKKTTHRAPRRRQDQAACA